MILKYLYTVNNVKSHHLLYFDSSHEFIVSSHEMWSVFGDNFLLKEARANCSLKNRLCEFF